MSSNQPPTLVVEAMDSVRQSNLFPLLFSAWFTERVYREEIADYRDRLQVDKEEVKVVKSVRIAARKIKKAITAAELRNKSAGIESECIWPQQPRIYNAPFYFFVLQNLGRVALRSM
jgi:hypothetical protein